MMSSFGFFVRNRRWIIKAIAYSFLVGLFIVQIGCGVGPRTPKSGFVGSSGSGGASNPPAPPSGGSGPVVDDAGFFIALSSPTGISATLHRAAQADAAIDYHTWLAGGAGGVPDTTGLTQECKIPLGTAGAAANFLCILEVEELDLYFQALQIQYHVPSTMCTYLRRKYFSFWAWEPGAGPANVSYDIYESGAIANPVNADAAGTPLCTTGYDHTTDTIPGPNCCYGSYTLTKNIENGSDSIDGNDPLVPSVTTEQWTGLEGNCVDGPLFDFLPDRKPTTNLPIYNSELTYIEGTGINSTYTFPKIIDSTVLNSTVTYNHNFFLANFIADPTGVAEPVPAAVTRTAVTGVYTPDIAYEFQCLDAAQELQARIALLIRDWDENPITAGGDPDTGFGGATEPPPYDDQLINDRYDWTDIKDPGSLGLDYPF